MEELNFQDRWLLWRERIRREYPHLKEEDLHYEPGKEEELLMRLQEKLGKTKKEIRNWLHVMG